MKNKGRNNINERGITLAILVIIIVVMMILTGTTVLLFEENNPTEQTEEMINALYTDKLEESNEVDQMTENFDRNILN
ncbi:MAG: hypothetical protein IKG14_03600 [Clostridia bacterium]|nr:hypothetical protein [Clostridia bacterium]